MTSSIGDDAVIGPSVVSPQSRDGPASTDSIRKQKMGKFSKASNSWSRLSVVLQDSGSENVGTLRLEMAQLRDILLDCRQENEELLHDIHIVFDENESLVQDLDLAYQEKAKLEDENKMLSKRLEETMVKLEENEQELAHVKQMKGKGSIGTGRRGFVHKSCSNAESFTSVSTGEVAEADMEVQLSGLKSELKRQARVWELERTRLLEQYNKDQVEKEALREVAKDSFLKMRASDREFKKSKKRMKRLESRLSSFTECSKGKRPAVGWSLVNRMKHGKDSTKVELDQNRDDKNASDTNNEEKVDDKRYEEDTILDHSTTELSMKFSPEDDASAEEKGKKSSSSEDGEHTNKEDRNSFRRSQKESMNLSFDHDESTDDEEDDDGDSADIAAIKDFHRSLSSRIMELSTSFDARQSTRGSIAFRGSMCVRARRASTLQSFQHSTVQALTGLTLDESFIEELEAELDEDDVWSDEKEENKSRSESPVANNDEDSDDSVARPVVENEEDKHSPSCQEKLDNDTKTAGRDTAVAATFRERHPNLWHAPRWNISKIKDHVGSSLKGRHHDSTSTATSQKC